MLVLLLAFYLTRSPSSEAAPLPTIETLDSSSIQDPTSFRTLSNIIWSCLATIFACTWASLHPNIPRSPRKEDEATFMRSMRFKLYNFVSNQLVLFIVALLAPEYILAWAIRQWFMAGKIAKKGRLFMCGLYPLSNQW